MNIRSATRQAIISAFGLSEDEEINKLVDDARIKHTPHLSELITLVAAEHHVPKTIVQKLEQVVAHIKLEDEQTENEKRFLDAVNQLVYEPQYHIENETVSVHEHEKDPGSGQIPR